MLPCETESELDTGCIIGKVSTSLLRIFHHQFQITAPQPSNSARNSGRLRPLICWWAHMTPNLEKGAKSPYDIQSRKMKYHRNCIDGYFDEVALYFCFGVINGCFSYHETLPCELVFPPLPEIIERLMIALTEPS
jgi:hypothetical protein